MTENETPAAGKRRRILLAAGLLVTAALFYCLNLLTPLYADDYAYLHSFATPGAAHRLESLEDLYISQVAHYQTMNGRVVPHVLAQLYLMAGKPVFNVVNTAAFVLLGLFIYFAAFGTWRRLRPLPLFAGYGLLWVSMLQFGQSCLWLTGACNYMHGALLAMAFLAPYRADRAERGGALRGALRALGMLALGLLAGCTNEIAAVTALFCSVLLCARRRLLGKRLPLWAFAGFLGACGGFAVVLLAPGQAVRTAGVGGLGSLGVWLSRVPGITFYAGLDLCVPAVLGIVLLVMSIRQGRGGSFLDWLRKHGVAAVWLLGSVAATYCMVAAPYFPWRAWCMPAVLAAGAVLAASGSVRLPRLEKKWVAVGVCAVCAGLLVSYGAAVSDLSRTWRQDRQREADILSQKAAGTLDVTACALESHSRYNCFLSEGDLWADPADWHNLVLQMYYEVRSVSLREGEYPG